MATYVSSGAFASRSLPDVIARAERLGIDHLELSSGLEPMDAFDGFVERLQRSPIRMSVHNYFPPPAVPFVLNLGSVDAGTLAMSREHVKRATALAERLGGQYYSVHSAFCVDFEPEMLGRAHVAQRRFRGDAERTYATFVESLMQLAPVAAGHGLDLLIENNVLTASGDGDLRAAPPVLMTSAEDMLRVVADVGEANLGLLIDVGHLRVSARTLGLDAGSELATLLPHARVLHLSDNDGSSDQNHALTDDAWFWPYLDRDDDRDVVIEAYALDDETILSQVELARRQLSAAVRPA